MKVKVSVGTVVWGNIITDAAGNTVEFAQDSIFSPVREALAENMGDGVNFLKNTGKFAILHLPCFQIDSGISSKGHSKHL